MIADSDVCGEPELFFFDTRNNLKHNSNNDIILRQLQVLMPHDRDKYVHFRKSYRRRICRR